MEEKYTVEQLKKDCEEVKKLNETLQKSIDELNYVIGNLKLEYPTMLFYKNGEIYLNKNFNFEESFVTKEDVIKMVNSLKDLSRSVVENNMFLEDAELVFKEQEG